MLGDAKSQGQFYHRAYSGWLIVARKRVKYGRIFAKYLADPNNLFIISSDFCHWGQRFRYTEYDERKGEIHESIKALDYEVSMKLNLVNDKIEGV